MVRWHRLVMTLKPELFAAALKPSRISRLVQVYGIEVLEHL